MTSSNHQPNILIIMADQLTAKALGCYGNDEVLSPNIDRLAESGVRFEHAYASSPLCTPARYAFMTGQNVSRCRGYDNASYMPSTMPTFAHYLRSTGYRTCLSGKMHFVGPDQLHGFEKRLTTDIYPADFGWVPDWTRPHERIAKWYHNMSSVVQAGVAEITNQLAYDDEVGYQAMREIYDHARSSDPRPLCLVASFIHPHDPYATRQKYWSMYENREISLPQVPRPPVQPDPHNRRLERVIDVDAVEVTENDILNARRAYYGNVSYIDEWVGRLHETVRECGMDRDTLIIFTSDHGDMLGEFGLWYKMSFREWSCRIPLIVHDPSRLSAKTVKSPVAHVDVLPTLVDIAAAGTAGQPEPIDPLDGRSLWPLCLGEGQDAEGIAISEYLAEGTCAPMLMIRQGRYKHVSCETDPDQLFDLGADPNEVCNLAEKISSAGILDEFRAIAGRHWNSDALKQEILKDQNRRRRVHAALQEGSRAEWDYNPPRNASDEYTRSHMDLTEHDILSRFPRPKPFAPS
ncbi:MAG: choline-sulfatase [Gammaproteobacteria bacterium]|nr:choline-sulfatase [Gammaproteobacteria bacterium]